MRGHENACDFGFPIRVILREAFETDIDEAYKAHVLDGIIAPYEKVIFIDNEPRVLNLVAQQHPHVPLVFVDTCHSPNVTPPTSALTIKDFTEFIRLMDRRVRR